MLKWAGRSFWQWYYSISRNDIVMCRVVRMTKKNGVLIGWLDLLGLRFQSLLITINTTLSLIYTIYSSPLHKH
jgi:hypothetical protein